MKFEVKWKNAITGAVKSFITKEYNEYPRDAKQYVNGLHQIGFIKDGKTRKTWVPYMCGDKYSHNVEWVKVCEAYTGRIIEELKGIM